MNELEVSKPESNAVTIQNSRESAEIQSAMVIAQKFPRDPNKVYTKIMQACKRKSLAEVAMYSYPRGGEKVTGPSIRLAEVLAQNYGNIVFGIKEHSQQNGESKMEAYCVDIENNVWSRKEFTVKHERFTKKSGVTNITDPRDIYEHVANLGARRLRACILGIIPSDIVDAAVSECEQTLIGSDEPIGDRVRKMVRAFESLGISSGMLEGRIGHSLGTVDQSEIVELAKIYQTIKDGQAKRQDFFEFNEVKPQTDLGEFFNGPTTIQG